MKVLVSRLPSGGFGSTLDILDIPPLNYGQLLTYSSEKSSDEVSDLIWDIDNLICSLNGWEKLSSYDTYALIAYRKMLTLSLTGQVTLANGETFDLSDVQFTDLKKDLIGSIKEVELGGKKYKPSILQMDKFYKILLNYQQDRIQSEKLAVLGAFLGIPSRELTSLTGEDISMCEMLYKNIIAHPVVELKGGREVILVGKASQLFQSLLELQKPDLTKIQYAEVPEG